jgi:hypothetical protein
LFKCVQPAGFDRDKRQPYVAPCAERAANRSDQEAATVDHQGVAGHEGLSH